MIDAKERQGLEELIEKLRALEIDMQQDNKMTFELQDVRIARMKLQKKLLMAEVEDVG